MANSKVLLMIAVTLVIVAYAQETAHEDLELAETKGKKHARHIQPNNRPSPQRFRPRIRNPKGRGRSDSSENGDSNGGGEYDPNDGYILISYGGSLKNEKKGQRYGNKYGSDYSVEVIGNVYGYEDDHGFHGGLYDGGYHEQDYVKGSSGTGGGIDESTGSKGNSEATVTGGDAGGSDVTSGKGESEGSKGNSGSMSESTGGGAGGSGGSISDAAVTSVDAGGSGGSMSDAAVTSVDAGGSGGSMSDAAVTSGDAMGGEGSVGETMSEGTKDNGESMVDSTATGGDIMGEEGAMGETETMSEGSKGTGEPMDEELTGGDAGTMSEMESMGDVKEGDAMEEGGAVDDMESMGEVSKGESMDAGGDEPGGEGSNGTSGSMTDGEDAGGDGEKSNGGKGSSETDNKGAKGSAEAGGSAEESDYVVEVEISGVDELEDEASNKGSVIEAKTNESPAMAGKDSTSSVTMELEKATGTTSDSSATVSSSAMGDKGMSLVVIDEMLKMAEMIKIDEMIKNGEMDKVDELLKNAEMIKPEAAKDSMASVTMEKAPGDGASSSTSGSTSTASVGQRRNGNGSPRLAKQGNGDKRSIIVGKRAPITPTNRVKQESGSVSSKPVKSSPVSNKKPQHPPVNVQKVSHNAGSARSKPVTNQGKPGAPSNATVTNGNRDSRRPSANIGKVSSVHPESRAKNENVTVSSKPVRSPIRSVDKEKKLPENGEKVNSSEGKSSIRPVSSAPTVNASNNGTTNTTVSNGERRFFSIGRGGITFGNRGKQEKVAASDTSVRNSGAGSEKVTNRGVRTSQSKPAQVMKPPSKLQANPMMGGIRPTFFTESRLKGETTTEKSIRNEKGGKTPKNSVKEKRGISISASTSSVNSKPVTNTSSGKGEKGSKGSDSSKGSGKKEVTSNTTESAPSNNPGNEKKGSPVSENGEKQISGFVRNASPLSIVRYLRKGVGRFL